MINLLDLTLSEAISPDNGSLRSNVVTLNVYTLMRGKAFDADKIADNELAYHLLSREKPAFTQTIDQRVSHIKDYRFLNVKLSGVKNYQYNPNYSYSLDFSLNDAPCSTVVIGRNGVGKTSFYAALEFATMSKMYTAKLRNVEDDDFIINKFTSRKNLSIDLKFKLKSHTKKLEDNKHPLTVPAHFCSEKDVFDIEGHDDLTNLVMTHLGLESFGVLLNKLKEMKKKLDGEFETFHVNCDEIDNLYFGKILPAAIYLSKIDSAKLTSIGITFRLSSIMGRQIEINGTTSDSDLRNLSKSLDSTTTLLEQEINVCSNYINSIIPPTYKRLQRLLKSVKGNILNWLNNGIEDKLLVNELEAINQQITKLQELRKNCANSLNSLIAADNREDAVRQLQQSIFDAQSSKSGFSTDIYEEKEFTMADSLNDLDELISYLDKKLQSIIDEQINPKLKAIFIPIINSYLDKELLEIEIINQDGNINVKLKTKDDTKLATDNQIEPFNPGEYLNTFRYKLFAVTLKFALSCTAKVLYNENWPIIIDDVFDSSDFNNRVDLERFIEKLITEYGKVDDIKSFPLQLIFFSQDEIIGDAVFKGLKLSNIPGKLCRLHSYTEVPDKLIKDGVKPIATDIDKCNIA